MAESVAGDALFERTGKAGIAPCTAACAGGIRGYRHARYHHCAIIIASVCGFTPQEEADELR